MVYTTTSIKPVIGKILRDTKLTDMTYADDIIEWIGEAMERMLIRYRLGKTYKELEITDHSHKIPCELVTLDAVFYNGVRLRKGTSSVDVRVTAWDAVKNTIDSYFVSDPTVTPENVNEQNYSLVKGADIKYQAYPLSSADFYTLKYDYIETSFKEGNIIICYTKRPSDDEGYPLIPDLQETRDAIFWYVCSKLVFTGYKLPIPEATFTFCDDKATQFFRKAKDIIRTQSEDEKEAMVQVLNNLIPPANYYETFFMGAEQRKYVE